MEPVAGIQNPGHRSHIANIEGQTNGRTQCQATSLVQLVPDVFLVRRVHHSLTSAGGNPASTIWLRSRLRPPPTLVPVPFIHVGNLAVQHQLQDARYDSHLD